MCNIAKTLDNKKLYKFADSLEKVLREAFLKDMSIEKFLQISAKMSLLTQYKIISLLETIGCSTEEINSALQHMKERYYEIVSNEKNLKDLIYILNGGSYRLDNRKDKRLDIEHAMEVIENWLIEEAILPYMHKLSKGSKWELNSFDKDRILNLSRPLKGGADFIDNDNIQYEFKTRWGPGRKIHIKPSSLPDNNPFEYHIYFSDIGVPGNKEILLPKKFRGAIYDLPIDQIRQQPLVNVPMWGNKQGYEFDLSQISPLITKNLSGDKIQQNFGPFSDDWIQGDKFLKKNKIK